MIFLINVHSLRLSSWWGRGRLIELGGDLYCDVLARDEHPLLLDVGLVHIAPFTINLEKITIFDLSGIYFSIVQFYHPLPPSHLRDSFFPP